MRRLLPFVSCALLALAAACGNSDSGGATGASGATKPASALLDDATTAIDASDWKKALALLDAVLADSRATNDEKVQAWQDKVLCEAQANGDAAAAAALQQMVASKVEFTPGHFAKLGNNLRDAKQLTAAVDVIDVATKKFGGDAAVRKQLKRLADSLRTELQASGDAEGIEKLKSLGYLGTSSEDEEEGAAEEPSSKDG